LNIVCAYNKIVVMPYQFMVTQHMLWLQVVSNSACRWICTQ